MKRPRNAKSQIIDAHTQPRDVKMERPEWREQLEEHLSNHLGPCRVLHELGAGFVHIDVRIFEPSRDRPYITGVTVGVSEHPMVVPDDELDRRHQELMIYLPASWPVEPNTGAAAEWPFWLLRTLGKFAYAEKTYFSPGHSVALSNPPEPFAPGVFFTTVLLLAPPEAPTFDDLTIGGTPCRFLSALPLTSAEAEYKLSHGSSALLQRLQEANVERQIDPARACAITGKTPPITTG